MRYLLLLVAGCVPLLVTGAAAQELDPRLYPKFEFDASGTLLVLSETIRIDPDSGTGTEIDAEDVLGVSKTSLQPKAALRWRPGRRHELELGFLRAVRSSEKVLSRPITVGDTSFTAGLRLNNSLRTSQAFLTYRYAFRVRPTSQIGAGLGLGLVLFKFDLDAVAGTTSGGADTTIVPYKSTKSFNGPTGSLGLYGRWKLGDRWYITSDLRGVYVKIENFKAVVGEIGGAGRYFFSNTVGAELGYDLGFYKVTLDHTGSNNGFANIDFTGQIKYTVNGFRAGLVVQF